MTEAVPPIIELNVASATPVVQTGPVGLTGATGANGTAMPNPVSGTASGRRNAAWATVLPLTGVPAGNSFTSMTGGINFGNVVSGSATDLSHHLDLYGGSYGFAITGGTLNMVSGQRHAFYTGGGYSSEIRTRELWFSASGYRWNFDNATGNMIWYDPSNNARMGWYYGVGGFTIWGYGSLPSSGTTRNLVVNGRGMNFPNVDGHGYNWNWDGTWVYGRVDNAVQIPFVNGCDERLKQDIAPSQFDCLAALRKIRVYQFRWRNFIDPIRPKLARDTDPTIPIGFIAQRLHEDFPESVATFPTAKCKGALAMWNVDVNTMMALLCGALQQLDTEVSEMVDA
jgi:hypothetical protein